MEYVLWKEKGPSSDVYHLLYCAERTYVKCQMTTLVRRMGDLPTYDCLDFICCKAYQVPFQLQLL